LPAIEKERACELPAIEKERAYLSLTTYIYIRPKSKAKTETGNFVKTISESRIRFACQNIQLYEI